VGIRQGCIKSCKAPSDILKKRPPSSETRLRRGLLIRNWIDEERFLTTGSSDRQRIVIVWRNRDGDHYSHHRGSRSHRTRADL
jgi:hypothetical protein